eukprot:7152161-Pyramimonas_sp.AAC.2
MSTVRSRDAAASSGSSTAVCSCCMGGPSAQVVPNGAAWQGEQTVCDCSAVPVGEQSGRSSRSCSGKRVDSVLCSPGCFARCSLSSWDMPGPAVLQLATGVTVIGR